jgi:hypothetical protein
MPSLPKGQRHPVELRERATRMVLPGPSRSRPGAPHGLRPPEPSDLQWSALLLLGGAYRGLQLLSALALCAAGVLGGSRRPRRPQARRDARWFAPGL